MSAPAPEGERPLWKGLLRGLVEELRLSARLHRSRWEQEQRDRTRVPSSWKPPTVPPRPRRD